MNQEIKEEERKVEQSESRTQEQGQQAEMQQNIDNYESALDSQLEGESQNSSSALNSINKENDNRRNLRRKRNEVDNYNFQKLKETNKGKQKRSSNDLHSLLKSTLDLVKERKAQSDEKMSSIRCHNQYCKDPYYDNELYESSSFIFKNKLLRFCKECVEFHKNGQFCDFCEQVYHENENTLDNKTWIMCEGCKRWNHAQCQYDNGYDRIFHNISNQKFKYYCPKCDQKDKRKFVQQKVVQTCNQGTNQRNFNYKANEKIRNGFSSQDLDDYEEENQKQSNFQESKYEKYHNSSYEIYTPYQRRILNTNTQANGNQNFGEINKQYKDCLIINIAPKSILDGVYGIKKYLTDEQIKNDLNLINNYYYQLNQLKEKDQQSQSSFQENINSEEIYNQNIVNEETQVNQAQSKIKEGLETIKAHIRNRQLEQDTGCLVVEDRNLRSKNQ